MFCFSKKIWISREKFANFWLISAGSFLKTFYFLLIPNSKHFLFSTNFQFLLKSCWRKNGVCNSSTVTNEYFWVFKHEPNVRIIFLIDKRVDSGPLCFVLHRMHLISCYKWQCWFIIYSCALILQTQSNLNWIQHSKLHVCYICVYRPVEILYGEFVVIVVMNKYIIHKDTSDFWTTWDGILTNKYSKLVPIIITN